MTVYPTQLNRPSRPARGGPAQPLDEEPLPRDKGASAALAFVVLLALAVLCVAAFLVVRLISPESLLIPLPALGSSPSSPSALPSPASGTQIEQAAQAGSALLAVDPPQGQIGALVTAWGQGWSPGEPVFLFLRSASEPEVRRYSYAAALADEAGAWRTAFTFPNEARWVSQDWAEVIAEGSRSGLRAAAPFALLWPTSTPTAPLPTLPPAATPLPISTVPPSPTPTPAPVITDWRGEYYANPWLADAPALVRNDNSPNFDWGEGSPAAGLPADGFSAQWTRELSFRQRVYRFFVAADDGVRLSIDGQVWVDEWHDGAFTLYTVDVALTQGVHTLALQYYENLGQAQVALDWAELPEPTATPQPTIPPTPTPEPSATAVPTPAALGPWRAEYYDNPDLQGQPVLQGDEATLDLDWGTGSPGDGVPQDEFSARWLAKAWLPAGAYEVEVDVDDGARLWLDGLLVVDGWVPSGGAVYRTQVWLEEGPHRFQVEYLEVDQAARIRVSIEAVSNPAHNEP